MSQRGSIEVECDAPPGLYKAGEKKRKISLKKVQDDLANLISMQKKPPPERVTKKSTVPQRKLSVYDVPGATSETNKRRKKRNSYIATAVIPLEKRLEVFLDNNRFQFVVFLCTLIALFGVDFVVAFLPSDPHDDIVGWASLFILILFGGELVVASWVKPGYFLSFYFWLDFVGALSLLPDIPMFWDTTDSESTESSEQLAILRAGRIVRTGTRTTKALRLVRLVRVARIMRLFRIIKFFRAATHHRARMQVESNDDRHSSRLGIRLADLLGKRVILGTIFLLLVLPNLEVVEVNTTALAGVNILEHTVNSTLQIENSTVVANHWTNPASTVESKTDAAIRLKNGTYVPKADVMTHIRQLPGVAGTLDTIFGHFQAPFDTPVRSLVISGIYVIQGNEELIKQIRTDALEVVISESGLSFVLYDRSTVLQEQAMYNILLTLTLIILMGTSAYLFNVDVKTYVVTPIKRTTAVIRKLATTLFLLSSEEESEADLNVLESTFVDSIVEQLNNFFKVGESDLSPKPQQVAPIPEQLTVQDLQRDQDIRDLIPDQRVTCLDSLESLFEDKQAMQFFKVFLTSEFAVESLTFVLACDQYQKYWSAMGNLVADINKKYIAEDAKFQVNISAVQRQEVVNNSKLANEDLFTAARTEIMNQLRADNFPRFKKSTLAQTLVEQKKTALKEYKMLKESQEQERLAKLKERETPKAIEIVKHFAARLLMQRLTYKPTAYHQPSKPNPSQAITQKETETVVEESEAELKEEESDKKSSSKDMNTKQQVRKSGDSAIQDAIQSATKNATTDESRKSNATSIERGASVEDLEAEEIA